LLPERLHGTLPVCIIGAQEGPPERPPGERTTEDIMRTALILGASIAALATAALAGPVDGACRRSGKGAPAPLCTCIQNVADMTLSMSDQKLAARLVLDPEKAEDIRLSKSARNKAFWSRY
jgi:hypothetical protein